MSLSLTRSAFRGNGVALWSGQLQLVGANGGSIVAATQVGISFGNTTDNSPVNFVGHGTVASNGPLVLSPTTSVNALTINGVANSAPILIVSANGTSGSTDIVVSRNGSTANTLSVGPSIDLSDSTTGTATLWQQSGGQTELWQRSTTGWGQVLFVNANRGVTINTPLSGTGLLVNGVAGSNALFVQGTGTASQSFGLTISAGTNAADQALLIRNAASNTTFQQILGDGSGRLGPNGSLGLSWNSAGAMVIAAPSSGIALAVTAVAGSAGISVTGNTGQDALQIRNTAGAAAYGLYVQAGTNTVDYAVNVVNNSASTAYFRVRGDGVVFGNDGAGSLFELGYKDTPLNSPGGSYVLVASDRGKTIPVVNGATITIPSGIFGGGAAVSFQIFAGSTGTIAQGSGLTMQWAGNSAATGNRTFTGAGLATVSFNSGSLALISGAGLS